MNWYQSHPDREMALSDDHDDPTDGLSWTQLLAALAKGAESDNDLPDDPKDFSTDLALPDCAADMRALASKRY